MVFTWAVGLPVYWSNHSVVCGPHSIPPPLIVSVHAEMPAPCSQHPADAKILLFTNH